MDELYREYLLEHYKHPRNKEKMMDADIQKYDSNPMCGDEIEIFVRLDDPKTKIKELKFQGQGCVICMASASLLTEELEGKTLKEIEKMGTEKIQEILGLTLTPTRIKCAMLPLVALKKGILDYRAKG